MPNARIVPFKQVDVFTDRPYQGNALAVVIDAEGMSTEQMQRIAAWTNLSETTFVLPPTKPGADYLLRIFTPRQELPFAGHPSVGSAHAVLEAEWAREHDHMLVMECADGLLPITVEGEGLERRIYVRTPAAVIEAPDMTQTVALAKALGATIKADPAPRAVKCGPTWIVAELESEAVVRGLKPDMNRIIEASRDYGAVGVAAYARAGRDDYALVVRCFAPIDSIPEDPVTGSGHACIAAFLLANELVEPGTSYIGSQGREVGRNGIVHVRIDEAGRIDIGGQSVTCVDGRIRV